jgi:hypothetical protein
MAEKFTADIVCQSCDGTGLYIGMSETNGCAVICYTCKGSGKVEHEFKYELFTKRKLRKGVKRVFKDSCGYGHAPDDVTTKEGVTIKFSQGGCTYEEFLDGVQPKPVTDLYCPKLWTGQSYSCKRCNDGCRLGSSISDCKFWKSKKKCWNEYLEPLRKIEHIEKLK